MPPEQSPACRSQPRSEPGGSGSGGYAPEGGARRMHRIRTPLEQAAGVGEVTPGAAQVIGIEAHAMLKWRAARRVPAASRRGS